MTRFLTIPLLLLGFAASAQTASNGKVRVTTPSKPDTLVIRLRCAPLSSAQRPLFIINGQIADSTLFSTLNTDQIDSIDTVKPPAAIKRYGNSAKNGAILITTKPAATGR